MGERQRNCATPRGEGSREDGARREMWSEGGGNLGARMGDGDEVAQGRLKDRNGDQRGGSE
jgi:hypothetical protein